MLERKEMDSDELKIASQTDCINYQINYDYDSSCRVYEGELYAFEQNVYNAVQKFDFKKWAPHAS